MARALMPLANGCEEMEAVIVVDVLRRAGWEVVTAGVDDGPVVASRGVRLLPDTTWAEVDPRAFDVIVLPGGGKGAERLCAHAGVLDALRRAAAEGRWTAAICAAPTVLQAAGLLEGRRVTSYPAFSDAFPGAHYVEDRVVVDGRIVTSRGPGTAFEFALALVEQLDGPAAARRVAEPMLLA